VFVSGVLALQCRKSAARCAWVTVRRGDITYWVFWFADMSHTLVDERFDPKDRGRGSAWSLWRKS
jgi:hypothetical protein